MQNEAELTVKAFFESIENCPCVMCHLMRPAMKNPDFTGVLLAAARNGGVTENDRAKLAHATYDLIDEVSPEQSRAMKREGTRQTLPAN